MRQKALGVWRRVFGEKREVMLRHNVWHGSRKYPWVGEVYHIVAQWGAQGLTMVRLCEFPNTAFNIGHFRVVGVVSWYWCFVGCFRRLFRCR